MNGDTRSYRCRRGGRRSTTARTGVTLLEVIVATALLATGGLITVASVTESLAAAERVRQRES